VCERERERVIRRRRGKREREGEERRERDVREREKRGNFYSRGSCVCVWVKLSFDQREGED